jgi:putative pyrroloquinoline-quinone-binding quinoprotein
LSLFSLVFGIHVLPPLAFCFYAMDVPILVFVYMYVGEGPSLWDCKPTGSPVFSRPAVLGNVLVVAHADGVLVGVSTDSGAQLWRVTLSGAVPMLVYTRQVNP